MTEVFVDMVLFSLVDKYQLFEETFCCNIQGKISSATFVSIRHGTHPGGS
jgi:hypothetical protein